MVASKLKVHRQTHPAMDARPRQPARMLTLTPFETVTDRASARREDDAWRDATKSKYRGEKKQKSISTRGGKKWHPAIIKQHSSKDTTLTNNDIELYSKIISCFLAHFIL